MGAMPVCAEHCVRTFAMVGRYGDRFVGGGLNWSRPISYQFAGFEAWASVCFSLIALNSHPALSLVKHRYLLSPLLVWTDRSNFSALISVRRRGLP